MAQFAKAPIAGRVKTRMIPFLSPLQACELHQSLVTTVIENVASESLPVRHQLWVTEAHEWFDHLHQNHALMVKQQCGADLGERLLSASQAVLAAHRAVILIGSDCPFIDQGVIRQVLLYLSKPVWDGVIIPAFDGGYVLLALKNAAPMVFEGIDWGSSKVFKQTMERFRRYRITVKCLPPMSDIDRPEDLPLYDHAFTPNR